MNPKIIEFQYKVKAEPNGRVELTTGNSAIKKWDATLGTQPTLAELTTIENSQLFKDWFQDHGGDPVKTTRRVAKEEFLTGKSEIIVRALVLLLLDEINNLRAKVIPALPPITAQQVKGILQDKINSGGAD